jgi:hypothetical protein
MTSQHRKATVVAEEDRRKKRRASAASEAAAKLAEDVAAAAAKAAGSAAPLPGIDEARAAGTTTSDGAGPAITITETEERDAEGQVVPPPPAAPPPDDNTLPSENPNDGPGTAIAAPRVMIDPETGEITLDRSSLVVRATRVSAEERSELSVRGSEKTTYASFTKRSPNTRWTQPETDLFFEGLGEFGTDFGMIQQKYLPDRNHTQLKKKFQREDKKDSSKVDQALKRPS